MIRLPGFLFLTFLALGAGKGVFAQDRTGEEDFIRVELRAFGWNVERRFAVEGTDRPVQVLRMQFTGPYAYFGPPVFRLQPLAGNTFGEGMDLVEPQDANAESGERKPAGKPVRLDLRAFGENPERLLLLFLPGGGDAARSVAVFDDTAALPDESNVHFYNLSSETLAVQVFGVAQAISPGEQKVWPVENGRRSSPLLVAIRDPDARVVYSSRFRLREDQRLVLMASNRSSGGAADSPVRFASFLERVVEDDSGDEGAESLIEPGM